MDIWTVLLAIVGGVILLTIGFIFSVIIVGVKAYYQQDDSDF